MEAGGPGVQGQRLLAGKFKATLDCVSSWLKNQDKQIYRLFIYT